MAEIKVSWRRTWQVKPYETETIELGMTDTFTPPAASLQNAQERGAAVAKVERTLLQELTKVGDAIMAERIAAAPPAPGGPAFDPRKLPPRL